MGKDYISRSFSARLAWLKNLVACFQENHSKFGLIIDVAAELFVKVEQYEASCIKADSPNAGKVDRFDRKSKAEEAVAVARKFVNSYLRYNNLVTDDDRINMGLTVTDSIKTPVVPPSTWPVADVRDYGPRMLRINYRDSVKDSRAKPAGVQGCEIRHAIMAEPPADVDDLLKSDFSTRSPHVFTFNQAQRGQVAYFVLRWESSRGQKGPWGEIYSAVIP